MLTSDSHSTGHVECLSPPGDTLTLCPPSLSDFSMFGNQFDGFNTLDPVEIGSGFSSYPLGSDGVIDSSVLFQTGVYEIRDETEGDEVISMFNLRED